MAHAGYPGVRQQVSAGQRTALSTGSVTQHVDGPGRIRVRAWWTWFFVSIDQLIVLRVASSALTIECGSGEKSSEGPNVCPPVIA